MTIKINVVSLQHQNKQTMKQIEHTELKKGMRIFDTNGFLQDEFEVVSVSEELNNIKLKPISECGGYLKREDGTVNFSFASSPFYTKQL